MKPLVTFHEELVLPEGRRATVAQFGEYHFFVLVGRVGAPRGESHAFGPFESKVEASRRAHLMQLRGYEGAVVV